MSDPAAPSTPPRVRLALHRTAWWSQRHDLLDAAGVRRARVHLRPLRGTAEVQLADGTTRDIVRDAGYGPWRTRTADGETRVLVTRQPGRDRYEVAWARGRCTFVRRATLGRRRYDVGVPGSEGAGVLGEVSERRFTRRLHDLEVPAWPDEVLATLAWLTALSARRALGAAASPR